MTEEKLLALTPSLPKKFQELINNTFNWSEYFFSWTDEITKIKTGYCTACKKEIHNFNNPYHNRTGLCPICGTFVQFKDKNRGRSRLFEENFLYLIQRLRNGGLLFRSMYVHRAFDLSIKPEFEYSEQERFYFVNGQIYRFERKYKSWAWLLPSDYFRLNQDNFFWVKRKRIATPSPLRNRMYGKFDGYVALKILDSKYKKDDFKYFDFNFLYSVKCSAIVEALELFYKNPVLFEKMQKEGFSDLLKEKIERSCYIYNIVNYRADSVPKALKLNKEQIRRLPNNPTHEDVFVMQHEKYLTKERVKDLKSIIKKNPFSDVYQFCRKNKDDLGKKVKYIAKQNLYIRDYNDYLEQLKLLEIEPTDKALYPSDFMIAHNACSAEITRRANAEKLAAEKEREKKFKKRYLELKKDLEFIDGDLFIRPATGGAELLKEGTTLNHCVYSNYSQKYLTGNTVICVIRKTDAPDVPFYTLELKPDYSTIIQCRGLRNCGMTDELKDFTQKWFKEILIRKETKKCKKTA